MNVNESLRYDDALKTAVLMASTTAATRLIYTGSLINGEKFFSECAANQSYAGSVFELMNCYDYRIVAVVTPKGDVVKCEDTPKNE
jgi:hypothetical protein